MEEGVNTLLDIDGFGITLLEEFEHIAPQPHVLPVQHLGVHVGPEVFERHVTKNVALPARHRRQGYIASECRVLCHCSRGLYGRLYSRFRIATQDVLFGTYTGNEL